MSNETGKEKGNFLKRFVDNLHLNFLILIGSFGAMGVISSFFEVINYCVKSVQNSVDAALGKFNNPQKPFSTFEVPKPKLQQLQQIEVPKSVEVIQPVQPKVLNLEVQGNLGKFFKEQSDNILNFFLKTLENLRLAIEKNNPGEIVFVIMPFVSGFGLGYVFAEYIKDPKEIDRKDINLIIILSLFLFFMSFGNLIIYSNELLDFMNKLSTGMSIGFFVSFVKSVAENYFRKSPLQSTQQ
ncbi:MAG: hypothetical protein Fur0024_4010 [Patescibacteria group bacterium]